MNFDNINNLNGISELLCVNLEGKCFEGLDFLLENLGLYYIYIVEWFKLGFGYKLVYGVVLESGGVI